MKFTSNFSSGFAPLAVKFTDQSTISPTSWNWSFGDGTWFNTTDSSQKSPAHTYSSAGTYITRLIACNAAGCNTTAPTKTISASMASFTMNATSGPAPLGVKFFDTTTGVTLSRWNWSFGDNTWYNTTTSSKRNATHTYTSPGSYMARLMVCTGSGSSHRCNTTPVGQVITVGGGPVNYYVFSDGVALYHGFEGNLDLSGADTTAQYFYNHLTDSSRCHEYDGTNYCWNERSNPVNDNTGSLYWSQTESADSIGANSVEFAFHAGHGWEDGILFGTANSYHKVFRSNMSFSRTKWVAFDSCNMLSANNNNRMNWTSVFNGLHILNGFETIGLIDEDIGPQFVERMRGGTYQGIPYPTTNIRNAWKFTLQGTIQNGTLKGAYLWADPSGEDFLPGHGPFYEPVKTNGQYTIRWDNFTCIQ